MSDFRLTARLVSPSAVASTATLASTATHVTGATSASTGSTTTAARAAGTSPAMQGALTPRDQIDLGTTGSLRRGVSGHRQEGAARARELQERQERLQRMREELDRSRSGAWDQYGAFLFGDDRGAAKDPGAWSPLGTIFLGPVVGTLIGSAIGDVAGGDDASATAEAVARRDARLRVRVTSRDDD